MALWDEIKKKNKKNTHPDELEKKLLEYEELYFKEKGDDALEIINIAFGLPDDIRAQVIDAIDKSIEKGLVNNKLDYFKVLKAACEDYTEEQVAEAYGHQLLGAYVVYLLLTKKPLNIRKSLDIKTKRKDDEEENNDNE